MWSQIKYNYSQKEIVKKLTHFFDDDVNYLKKQIKNFLDNQIQEGLVASVDNMESHNRNDRSNSPPGELTQNSPRLIAPELIKCTDMKDLLLDPIHNVDDSGWPATKAN